jgi:hypothetical protein
VLDPQKRSLHVVDAHHRFCHEADRLRVPAHLQHVLRVTAGRSSLG